MKELETKLIAVITETMPRGEDGKIQDRLLHSDLIVAVTEALRIHDVVGRSEQFYCVSSDALVYGKPCNKWCGDENCKALCKQ